MTRRVTSEKLKKKLHTSVSAEGLNKEVRPFTVSKVVWFLFLPHGTLHMASGPKISLDHMLTIFVMLVFFILLYCCIFRE